MSWIEKKVYSLEKIINYIYCKVKNLTNIHNELDGLQGGQEGQYYHLTEEQYNNIDNIELTDEKVQITEDTAFAQIGQTQKDFNKNVSNFKTSSDLKNQEQDDRLESIEGINYTWSPTNRTLTLYDREGTQLSQVSLVSLDNEGTDLRYNASTLSLELYNTDNELLDSIPVSSFIGSVGTQLQLNSNQLQLKDSQGNILSTVSFTVSNIDGLQFALNNKQDRLQDVTTNIGVGKTDASATEKLDVNGNIKATGFKTPSGTLTQALTANGGVFDLDNKLSIQANVSTGVNISFSTDTVYGTLATPETGNITADVTNAKLGVTNIIIHNSGTAPTFGSQFKKLSGSGSYVVGVVNYIYCTFISSTEIIYSINQRS